MSNTVSTKTENITVVTVVAQGPQGPVGVAGPTGSADGIWFEVGSKATASHDIEITGSLTVSGSNTFRNIGPAIFTGNITASGHISASTFYGDGSNLSGVLSDLNGSGVVSSSAQIASEVSGAFDSVSASLASDVTTNAGNISTNTGNISTNTGNISTNTSNISGVDGRVSTLEGKTLISSSAQIASQVSGAFDSVSASLASDITANAGNISTNTSNISGVDGRVSTLEGKTLISSSLQFNNLASPFSGAFTGSFVGDGSQLTGLVGVDNLWYNGGSMITSSVDVGVAGFISASQVRAANQVLARGPISGTIVEASQYFTGSFRGDGSQLTGIVGGSSEWYDGGTFISSSKDVVIKDAVLEMRNSLDDVVLTLSTSSIAGQLFNVVNNIGETVLGVKDARVEVSTSLYVTGSQVDFTAANTVSATSLTASFFSASSGTGSFSGSFEGSFSGDGSNLTNISTDDWKNLGTELTASKDVLITGSLRVLDSSQDIRFVNLPTAGALDTVEYVGVNAEGRFFKTGSAVAGGGEIVDADWKDLNTAVTTSKDVDITGSLVLTGAATASVFSGSYVGDIAGLYGDATTNDFSASYALTASYALNVQQAGIFVNTGSFYNTTNNVGVTGSFVVQGPVTASNFTGSFKGDGSQLTGLPTDSEWHNGVSFISSSKNVNITGSLGVSGSHTLTGDGANIFSVRNTAGDTLFRIQEPVGGLFLDVQNTSGQTLFSVSTGTTYVSESLSVSGSLTVHASEINFANLPTSDPAVVGQLYRDGSGNIKVSI